MSILGNWIINAAPSFDDVKKAVRVVSSRGKVLYRTNVENRDCEEEEVDMSELPEGIVKMLSDEDMVVVNTDNSEE